MAVTVECPRCTHKQNIDDGRADKETPCKICHFLIQPAGVKPKSTEKTKLAGAGGAKTSLAKDGIQAGPPAVTKSATDKNVKATPPKVNATKKREKDDDDDDDDRPRKNRKPAATSAEGSSNSMMYVVGGGAAFLLLLVVCGGGLGLMFFMRGSGKPEPQLAQNNDPPPAPWIIENIPNPKIIIIPPNPIPNPIPNPDPIPNLIQPPPQSERLDPNNPGDVDRVLELMRGPQQQRSPALAWLNAANPDHPRKADVAKQMEALFNQYYLSPLGNDGFFNPYFRWVTAENVPSLIRLAESTKFTPWDNRYRQDAIKHLAKFKDPRGIPAIVKRLDNAFDRGVVIQALEEFGAAAQPEILKLMNHPDNGIRDVARQLLMKTNAPESAKLAQTLTDLGSKDNRQRDAAVNYLVNAPVDPQRRTEVAQAMNLALGTLNGPFINGEIFRALEKWHTAENVPVLAKIVETNRPGSREAMQLLGKMRMPESTKVIARQLGKSFEAYGALRDAGAAAEPAVVEVLATTLDQRIRMDCIRLLGDIGTRNGGSLVVMQQLVMRFPQDNLLRVQAQMASQRILSRP